MRLLDKRYRGIGVGVGTQPILGRVHSAQIKLGELFLPTSFAIMELQNIDILFGLDMLKRHQCSIDLASNVLRIGDTVVPFLYEHQLPAAAQQKHDELVEQYRRLPPDAADTATNTTSSFSGGGQALGQASSSSSSFPGSGQALGQASSTSASASTSKAAAQDPREPHIETVSRADMSDHLRC